MKKRALAVCAISLAAIVACACSAPSAMSPRSAPENLAQGTAATDGESEAHPLESEQEAEAVEIQEDAGDQCLNQMNGSDSQQGKSAREAEFAGSTERYSHADSRSEGEGKALPEEAVTEKRWVEEVEQVWVEDQAAWTEETPIFNTVEVAVCNICGAEITGSTSAHNKQHMLAGEGSGWHSETRTEQVGVESVSHEAAGHWETRVIGGHWE